MQTRRLVLTTLLLASLLAPLAGCRGTLLKQGYYAVRGAKGEFYEVQVVNPQQLAAYESIRVEPFTNDLGERVPAEVIAEINRNTSEIVAESHLFYPEGKQLVAQGRIIHYTGKSGLMGSVWSIAGSTEECICRVELRDGETDESIGEAVCWGSVKSALRRGASEFGAGVGKGVLEWIEERLPDEVVEARKEELEEE